MTLQNRKGRSKTHWAKCRALTCKYGKKRGIFLSKLAFDEFASFFSHLASM
jgi:hypothetical protein